MSTICKSYILILLINQIIAKHLLIIGAIEISLSIFRSNSNLLMENKGAVQD